VFHDITTGNNIVPCEDSTPDCTNGSFGYKAGVGYDLVTGLGSVDAYNLITAWGGIPVAPTTTTVTVSPNNIQSSGSAVLTATVKAASGTASPNGYVSFTLGSIMLGAKALSGSGGTASASITVTGGQLVAANNAIQVSYPGGPTFGPSSGTATLTLGTPTQAPTATSKVLVTVTPNPVYQQAPNANGATFVFTVQLNETAGVATTLTGFTFDGVNFSSSIASFFGSANLPAHSSLSTTLSAGNIAVPTTVTIVFNGVDASGTKWTQQIGVPFLPQQ
jgi:hypothetical protein